MLYLKEIDMRYICPKCDGRLSENQSRYNVWECPSCNGKFRGIHCDIDMADYYSSMFPLSLKFWYTSLFDSSYDIGCANRTNCPFCNSIVNGNNGSGKNGWWPSVCGHCSSQLPMDYVDEPIVSEPIPERKKTKKPKSDYKKLMDLINKL